MLLSGMGRAGEAITTATTGLQRDLTGGETVGEQPPYSTITRQDRCYGIFGKDRIGFPLSCGAELLTCLVGLIIDIEASNIE
jgi:hypothetical protein